MIRPKSAVPLLCSIFASVALLTATPVCAQEWQAKHVVKTYTVTGATPFELYTSIGENGPLLSSRRAIAHTNWDLKWRREYRPDGNACVLKSALPFLIVTTTLPMPGEKLDAATNKKWQSFLVGITAHEKVHGEDIVAMTERIISSTVGLRVDNDKGCKAIRTRVLKLVQAEVDMYKEKSAAFDRTDMAEGGNIHRLILELLNGA